MKEKSLKRVVLLLVILVGSAAVGLAQSGPSMPSPMPSQMPSAPPPLMPPLEMKASGDYLFVLQGATLYRYSVASGQLAGSLVLTEEKTPQMPPAPGPGGLLIAAGGSGKPETLLVLMGKRLFVVNPATFSKPTVIAIPEPSAPQKPDAKAATGSAAGQPPAPAGADNSSAPPAPPMGAPGQNLGPGPGQPFGQQPGMSMGPGAGPMMQPMAPGGPGMRGFGPGAGPMSAMMPMMASMPPMPHFELKGTTLFLMHGRTLWAIDYQSGDVKTIALPEPAKTEK